jgi:long-chain acyl-CoA synthetase
MVTHQRLYPGTYARERPDEPAVIWARNGELTTWRNLDAASNQIARLLWAKGLRKGDHIAVLSENHPIYFQIVWAALRSGLYYTPISCYLTPPEVAEVLRVSDANVLFASERQTETAERALLELTEVRHCFRFGGSGAAAPPLGWEDLDPALSSIPADPLEDEPEGAPLWFSSGTSGRPKAVVRSLPDEPNDPVALHYAKAFGLSAETVHLCLGPLHHAAPIGFSTAVLRLGGTVVLTDEFNPEGVLAYIQRYLVTFGHFVPTMFVRLLKLPEETRRGYDVSSLERVIHGAAPCPVKTKEQMIRWWGPIIDEYYGGTEGVGSTIITAAEWLSKPGSVGKASRGTIHIVDESGQEITDGSDGMVYFENPEATTKYRDDPTETASITHALGWQTLGDIGHLDQDGYLFLTDRWMHKVITGGVNVFPREVEDVLLSHPQVLDAAVIGIPNDDLGEEIRGVVQLIDPTRAGDQLAQDLIDYCRVRLAKHKCPRWIDFDDQLPRQSNGKLYKRLIRDRYWVDRATNI